MTQPKAKSRVSFNPGLHGVITTIANPDTTFGDFTEITPPDSLFVTPEDEDFWVISAAPADYDNDGDLDILILEIWGPDRLIWCGEIMMAMAISILWWEQTARQ